MHHYIEESNDVLHKRGYRLTPQRYLILQVIQDANEHISLEQIAERVQRINPCVSLSTIYRTLELLREVELVHESKLPGKPVQYEMPRNKSHHHLVCQRCQCVLHLEDDLLGTLTERLQQHHHFHNISLSLLVSGCCDACWQDMQQEAHVAV